MPRSIRLTKKRLAGLHSALTFDEILYERFRRLNEDLQRREYALAKSKRVVRVVQRRGNIDYALQILELHPTEDGTIVICR